MKREEKHPGHNDFFLSHFHLRRTTGENLAIVPHSSVFCLPSTHPFTLASHCTHVQFPAFREKDKNFCHEKISRKLGETVRENFVSCRFLFVLFERTVRFICYVCSYVPFVSHLGKKHFTT